MTQSVETATPPRTVEGLLAAAAVETGLEDFGDRYFVTGLTALVDALPREAALNAVGDQMVYGGILRLLSNRLRYVRDVKMHPEILREKIVKPIIILGLPRTGTSKLQRIMSADPAVQRLDFWRTINPAPFPGEEPGNPKARIQAALVVEQTLTTMFPGWMARHPMEALEPDEELHIYGRVVRVRNLVAVLAGAVVLRVHPPVRSATDVPAPARDVAVPAMAGRRASRPAVDL